VIPFSSLHRYQREDSVWANDYLTPLEAYKVGFDESVAELIKPFVFINCANDERVPINVEPIPLQVKSPAEFGDDWSQPLEKEDRALIDHYFKRKERLRKSLAFIEVKAGGVTHCVDLEGPDGRGITFEAPRNSLMQGIGLEVFDDLLIGNFMKTTLHNVDSLYDPEFTRTVAKFADNGRVETEAEIRQYMKEYARRAGPEWLLHICEEGSMQHFRRYVSRGTWFYKGAKRIYYRLRSRV
jgi:hypothetical protein